MAFQNKREIPVAATPRVRDTPYRTVHLARGFMGDVGSNPAERITDPEAGGATGEARFAETPFSRRPPRTTVDAR